MDELKAELDVSEVYFTRLKNELERNELDHCLECGLDPNRAIQYTKELGDKLVSHVLDALTIHVAEVTAGTSADYEEGFRDAIAEMDDLKNQIRVRWFGAGDATGK
jgi:membrane-bound inhibitor of C-type lysozyme